ncbi:MAG: STAS domain-containing protein [Candidatus Lindowbacteria bacterium]|nr:STAS domain-containing protein [Candidatus Lindowbacteria bacterium]
MDWIGFADQTEEEKDLEITSTTEDNACVVSLSGDLDTSTTAAVESALTKALEDHDTLIVDISGVPFADSSGLGGLIGVYKRAKAAGKEVRLRKPTPIVSEILTITRMKRFFPVDE